MTNGFKAVMSNHAGQVLGTIDSTTGNALAYGFQGQVTCVLLQCTDLGWDPAGINARGLYVFNTGIGAVIGFGSTEFSLLQSGSPYIDLLNDDAVFANQYAFGINDQDQVLMGGGSRPSGVLSPSAIPEPSGIALLITVLGILSFIVLRRSTLRLRTK
jgi:hypothetical protein